MSCHTACVEGRGNFVKLVFACYPYMGSGGATQASLYLRKHVIPPELFPQILEKYFLKDVLDLIS